MSAYPSWTPGKTLRAADLRAMQPDIIQATITQAISTNSLETNDDTLFFRAEAGAKYLVEAYLNVNISLANDIGFTWNAPINATARNLSWSSTEVDASMIARTKTRVSVIAFGTSLLVGNHRVEETTDLFVMQKFALDNPDVAGDVYLSYTPGTIQVGTLNRDLYSFLRVTRFA